METSDVDEAISELAATATAVAKVAAKEWLYFNTRWHGYQAVAVAAISYTALINIPKAINNNINSYFFLVHITKFSCVVRNLDVQS